MVKIFNSFGGKNPLAASLADMGKQLFGDRTANELNSEKLYAAQRENSETDNLMRRVGTSGAQTLGSDPIAQAMMIGSGYDPGKFGEIGLMGAATGYGARDPRTQNWQVGTGQSYDNTSGAFDTKMAETTRNNNMASADRRYGVDESQETERNKFFNEPVPVIRQDGAAGFAPQGEVSNMSVSPILSESDQKGTMLGRNWGDLGSLDPQQQEVLGARTGSSGTPRNYIVPGPEGRPQTFITYDGMTDAQSGRPLPSGGYIGNVEGGAGDVGLTNSTQSGLQQSNVAYDKFNAVMDMAVPLTKDPTLFGPQGFARSKVQDIMQSLGGGAALDQIRGELPGIVDAETGQSIGQRAARELIPEFYDPRLGEVEALWGILLYQGAAALAGQENRSVSDKDVSMMRNILGDPHSLFASNLSMKTKLDTARRLVDAGRAVNDRYLGGGGQPNTPAAQPQGAQETVIDGVKIRRIQ